MGVDGCDSVEKRSSRWAELPIEILNLFMERLYFTDQIRLRAVCKSWKAIDRVPSNIDKLPWWLMSYDCQNKSFIYFDPALKTTYTLNIPAASYGDFFLAAVLLASKKGWMLLRDWQQSLIFLYNTTRQQIIKLPSWSSTPNYIHRATISADPTSPDCIFFLVHDDSLLTDTRKNICISSYRLGDKEWSTYNIPMHDPIPRIMDVVYSKGTLYCVFDKGELGTFSVAHNSWRLLSPLVHRPEHDRYRHLELKFGLVELYGEIVLLLIPIYGSGKPFLVFSFDPSKEKYWVKNDSLGSGAAVFIDMKSSFGVTIRGDDEQTTNLTDDVHFIQGNCRNSALQNVVGAAPPSSAPDFIYQPI